MTGRASSILSQYSERLRRGGPGGFFRHGLKRPLILALRERNPARHSWIDAAPLTRAAPVREAGAAVFSNGRWSQCLRKRKMSQVSQV